MKLMPVLRVDVFNVFIFIFFYMLLSTVIAYLSSKDGFKRGSDRSWIKNEDKFSVYFLEYVFLAFIIFSIFVPIKMDSNTFYIGLGVYAIAFILSIYTNVSYVTAPLDRLITKGIYKYSRNPAYICNAILILSVSLLSATYIFIIFMILFLVSSYFTVLVEEKYCMEKYGDEYKKYIKKTPRYLFF